jgi:hypothetical protein
VKRTISGRRNRQTQKSRKKESNASAFSSSDSGEIESADDDSHFEPTDGAGDNDKDDDDEGGEINSFASANAHDSDINNNPNPPLRTRHSGKHCTPPSPPARSDTRAIVGSMPLGAPKAQKSVIRRIVLFVKSTIMSDQIRDQYQVI